jgi:hypothetical protein
MSNLNSTKDYDAKIILQEAVARLRKSGRLLCEDGYRARWRRLPFSLVRFFWASKRNELGLAGYEATIPVNIQNSFA